MELVSVIVPVYKAEKFLNRCIDSILAQTYENFELILIDDGSPDNSGAICDEYAQKDNRIKAIHQENAGVSVARNTGIAQAKGDWILFIDSDDFVETEYISSLLKVSRLDSLIIQGYKTVSANHTIAIQSLNEKQYDKTNFSQLFAEPKFYEYGHPFGKLYETKLIKQHQIQFNTNLSYAEDLIFLLNYILHINRILYISGTYYNYTISPNSLSQQINPFENEYLLFNEFSQLNTAIAKKYNFRIQPETFHYMAVLLIRCILSIYKSQFVRFSERINALKALIKKRRIVQLYYQPNAFFLKIIRILFLHNIYLLDIFCKLKFPRK